MVELTPEDKLTVDSASRQVEINEWQYNNKMETVFVLQLLFLGIIIVAIVFYFNSVGALGSSFAWYVTVLTAIVISLIIANRALYTNARRDTRFWNRRRFGEDNQKTSAASAMDGSWQDYIAALKAYMNGQSGRDSCNCNGPAAAAAPVATAARAATRTPATNNASQ